MSKVSMITLHNIQITKFVSLLSIAAFSFYSGLAYSGAWTGPKGVTYNKLGLNYFSTDQAYDRDGDTQDTDGTFTDLNLSYYGEHGFRDDLNGFISVAFKSVEADPDDGASASTSAIGDIDLGIRKNLYNGDKGVFSLQGLVKIPEAYDSDDTPPVGSGQVDFEIRALYGRSLYPKPFYFGLEGGYRYRDDEPSDEWKYLIEFGYTASEKVSLRAKLDGTMSAKNADRSTTTTSNPTLADDFDLGKLELTTAFTLKKDTMFLEISWTPTIYGRNTAVGNTLGISFVYAAR